MKSYLPRLSATSIWFALIIQLCLPVPPAYSTTETFEKAASNPTLTLIPAGCYRMGDNFGDGYFNEKPAHDVCVSDFLIGKHAVTRNEFKQFVEATGYRTEAEQGDGCFIYTGTTWRKVASANWRSPGFAQENDHPVVCVSWNDASAYTHWLANTLHKEYRLPTEAEWEYAARSGGKLQRFAGGNEPDAFAWYAGNAGNKTHSVGQKQPNGLGLYDMSGNVWQWTTDWYSEHYYRESGRDNPLGPPSGRSRVFRGGSWFYDQQGIRASYRDFSVPTYRSSYLGFRLAAPVPTK